MENNVKYRTLVAVLSAAALTVALAGCVGVSQPRSPDTAPKATTSGSSTDPSFAPEPEAEPQKPSNLAFGDAMEWKNGLMVSVSVPVEFTPSEYAAGGTLPYNVVFNVTVTNGSTENFDSYVYLTVTSGGSAGEQVFDSANGLTGPPTGVILPGQTITFASGWNIADPASIVLSVAPGFEYQDAIFTNAQ